jgi:hypothetical protein
MLNTVMSITASSISTVEAMAHHVAAVLPPNKSCVLDMSGSDLSKDLDDDMSVDSSVPFSVPSQMGLSCHRQDNG